MSNKHMLRFASRVAHPGRRGAYLTAAILVLLSVTIGASTYSGLTMSAWFSTDAQFCAFATTQYTTNGNRPVLIVSYAARAGGMPSCPASDGHSTWNFAPVTTTLAPTTLMPSTTSAVTTHLPNSTTTGVPFTTTDPATTSSTTDASSTTAPTTSEAPTSTAASSGRRFHELASNNESSTVAPTSSTTTTPSTTEAPSATPNPSSTTMSSATTAATSTATPSTTTSSPSNTSTAPASTNSSGSTTTVPSTAVPQLYVSFRFTADSDERLMEQENRLLLAAPSAILTQFGMTQFAFSAPADPSVSFISPTDPRVNTSGLGDASEYLFSFQLTTAYRYRNSYGALLPWILNAPSAGTMWRTLAIALLGYSNPSQAEIDTAAKWFPMPNVGVNGVVRRVSEFNETSELNNVMSPPTHAASLGNAGGGSGFTLSFFLTGGQATSSASSATVLACLNSAPIRAQLAAQLGGALALKMYRIQEDGLAPVISSFDLRAEAAQQEYSKQKSYFAAGLIAITVVFSAALMALWIWTGSGRTMASSPTSNLTREKEQ